MKGQWFLLWIALLAWVYSLVFSRPSRRIVKEIKAFIEQEFKEDLQKFESKNNT